GGGRAWLAFWRRIKDAGIATGQEEIGFLLASAHEAGKFFSTGRVVVSGQIGRRITQPPCPPELCPFPFHRASAKVEYDGRASVQLMLLAIGGRGRNNGRRDLLGQNCGEDSIGLRPS